MKKFLFVAFVIAFVVTAVSSKNIFNKINKTNTAIAFSAGSTGPN